MDENQRKSYEISYLLNPNEGTDLMSNLLKDMGLEIINDGGVTEIRLAYPIKKETRANFGYLHFGAEPEVVNKLRDSLQLNVNVLRFLIVTPPFVKIQSRREEGNYRVKPAEEARPEISNSSLEEKLEEINI
jgi:ribosomal protein S6